MAMVSHVPERISEVRMTEKTFRVGDWVEVSGADEVIKTLDSDGCLDSLPFMPEMLRYCGRRFQVIKSAHKPCDPTGCTGLRRMVDAVHLDVRCDGSEHGGCEARCLIFWKTGWLKHVDGPAGEEKNAQPSVSEDTLKWLRSTTRHEESVDGKIRYRCQATEIVRATTALPATDIRQYVDDLASKNVTPRDFFWNLGAVLGKATIIRLRKLIGLPVAGPSSTEDAETVERLNLQPGEIVQVRTAEEILATLDRDWKNKGLALEKEMLRHCGRSYRVVCRVNRIIDERTGRMLKLADECIILDGVKCAGLENIGRLFCSRAPYLYWREAWLRRAPSGGSL
jgi:hypothetical protein